MKDCGTLLLQYMLHQNRSLTGEDKSVSDGSEERRVGDASVDRLGPDDAGRSASSDLRIGRNCYRCLRAYSDACVPGRAGGGVQILCSVR